MEIDETTNQEHGSVRHDSMCHDKVCMHLRLCLSSLLAGNLAVCRVISMCLCLCIRERVCLNMILAYSQRAYILISYTNISL